MKCQVLSFLGKIRKYFKMLSAENRIRHKKNVIVYIPRLIQQKTIGDIFLIVPRKQDLTFHANCRISFLKKK